VIVTEWYHNDWVIDRTKQEATFGEIAEMICEYGKLIEAECVEMGFEVLGMDKGFE